MDIQGEARKLYIQGEARKLVEEARIMHYAVATAENAEISFYRYTPYMSSRKLLLELIGLSYPDLPTDDIYDVWVDRNETIAYCANVVKERLKWTDMDESDDVA